MGIISFFGLFVGSLIDPSGTRREAFFSKASSLGSKLGGSSVGGSSRGSGGTGNATGSATGSGNGSGNGSGKATGSSKWDSGSTDGLRKLPGKGNITGFGGGGMFSLCMLTLVGTFFSLRLTTDCSKQDLLPSVAALAETAAGKSPSHLYKMSSS